MRHDSSGRVSALVLDDGAEIGCSGLIVADGARSTLGRSWVASGTRRPSTRVAIRGYIEPRRARNEPWITSHLELRSPQREVLPGYGWIFPLEHGEGEHRRGRARHDQTAGRRRPATADVLLRRPAPRVEMSTMSRSAGKSTLLPMGGTVSGVAGPNWMLIGDAAACVNPLNGEGIDYGAGDRKAGGRAAGHRRLDIGVARRC